MERGTIIAISIAAVAVGGMGYHFYSEYNAKIERERIAHETAVKAASEKEKKAAEELKRLQDKEQEAARKLADLERQQKQIQDQPNLPSDETVIIGSGKSSPAAPSAPKAPAKRLPALIGDGPPPGQPMPPIIPAAEKFISEARLTSTSLDAATIPYAVINRQTYRVGNRIVIAPGQELTVTTIEDGFITFSGGQYRFKMRLASATQ